MENEWDEESGETEGDVVCRLRKRSKRDNWLAIRRRSSPIQLARCIKVVYSEQRMAIKEMGFGRLLKFKVDGMPAKLANYMVEMFNPSTMELNFPCGNTKVNVEAIQKLLGIPHTSVNLSSRPNLAEMDETVRRWKDRFPGRYGCLRPCILDHITGELDFASINWCQLVLEKLKKCKNSWKSNDLNRPFTGSLTVLILLYMDSVRCRGMEVDYSIYPMTFWIKEKLKKREKVEICSGGFGSGKLKSLTICTEKMDDEPTIQVCKDNI
ncbi:hypothetical protein Hanom_Chr12g01142211 [Helianthus anomalus]